MHLVCNCTASQGAQPTTGPPSRHRRRLTVRQRVIIRGSAKDFRYLTSLRQGALAFIDPRANRAAQILAGELLGSVNMESPVQITYRDVDPNPSMDAAIRKQVDRLDALYPKIISCRVAVETASQRHRTGNPFQIHIDLSVPGAELIVGRPQSKGNQHHDFFIALRDAFRAARRELKTYSQKQRVDVKRHDAAPHALVTDIFRGEGYGFLRAMDGHSIYFHANAVAGGMDNLEVGMIASYVEEPGEKGPQATVVRSIGWAQTTSTTPSA